MVKEVKYEVIGSTEFNWKNRLEKHMTNDFSKDVRSIKDKKKDIIAEYGLESYEARVWLTWKCHLLPYLSTLALLCVINSPYI